MHKSINSDKYVNRFPSCVFVKLTGSLFKTSKNLFSSLGIFTKDKLVNSEIFELKLTIRFGKEKIDVPGGSVWFGVKRGELRLKMTNAKIPIEKQGLVPVLENGLNVEIQQEEGLEIEGGASFGAASSINARRKGVTKTSSKAIVKSYSISTSGAEHEPVWIFEAKSHASILIGQVNEVPLGPVCMCNPKQCSIRATFSLRGQQDISLIEAEGLWSKNIGRNKLAILERELFLRYISARLNPWLSSAEVTYG